MKHHDISKGTAPKAKALEGAKKLKASHPATHPTPGLRSEDEFIAHMKKTPGKYEGYMKRKELNAKKDSNGFGAKLLHGYQEASKKRALNKIK